MVISCFSGGGGASGRFKEDLINIVGPSDQLVVDVMIGRLNGNWSQLHLMLLQPDLLLIGVLDPFLIRDL